MSPHQSTTKIEGWILMLVNAIFVVLASLGVVQDPTVKGVADSEKSLRKEEPTPPNETGSIV